MGKYYKHPKYGHVYGESLWTPLGRFTWPSLVTPKEPPPPSPGQQPGQPRYECSILLPKGEPKVKQFFKAVAAQVEEMLPLFNKGRKSTISGVSYCVDGDETDLEKYPYQADNFVLVARNAKEVSVCTKAKEDVDAGLIAGGMLGNLRVTPMITAHGLSYKLEMVAFRKDDKVRFGGGVRNMKAFLDELEAIEGEAETEEVDVTADEELGEDQVAAEGERESSDIPGEDTPEVEVEEEIDEGPEEDEEEEEEQEEEEEAPPPPVKKANIKRPPVAQPKPTPKPQPAPAQAAPTGSKLTPAQIRAQVIANQRKKIAAKAQAGGKGKAGASSVL